MSAIEVITLVNTLVKALQALGLNLGQVAELQRRAAAEGREFGLDDLASLAEERKRALADLDAAIAAAKASGR